MSWFRYRLVWDPAWHIFGPEHAVKMVADSLGLQA